jgi:hypothetical protein
MTLKASHLLDILERVGEADIGPLVMPAMVFGMAKETL